MPWILQILRTLGHSQVCAIHSCSPGKLLKGDFRDPLMVSFPYYSHIFRDSYGSGMGIAWERGPIIEGPWKSYWTAASWWKLPAILQKKLCFWKDQVPEDDTRFHWRKWIAPTCTCPTSTKVILETNILYHLKKTSGPNATRAIFDIFLEL